MWMRFTSGGGTEFKRVSPNFPAAPYDQWHAHCVTLVAPNTAGSGAIYFDSGTPRTPIDSGSSTGTVVNSSAQLTLGAAQGHMAHVAIFPTTLTDAQVGVLMDAARADGWIA